MAAACDNDSPEGEQGKQRAKVESQPPVVVEELAIEVKSQPDERQDEDSDSWDEDGEVATMSLKSAVLMRIKY